MDELIKELRDFGFSNEFLKVVEDQKFDEIIPSEEYEAEYLAYDTSVEYLTESSIGQLSNNE